MHEKTDGELARAVRRRAKRARSFSIYCLLFPILCGCAKPIKSDLVAAPPPKLEAGWISHDTRGALTVAAPDNWILSRSALSQSGLNLQEMPATMAGTSQNSTSESEAAPAAPATSAAPPDAVDPGDVDAQNSKGVVLELYDKNVKPIPGEVTTRLYVEKDGASGSLEESAKKFAKDFKATPSKVNLPVGPAETFKSEDTSKGGDVVTDVCYVIDNGSESYKFVFETSNHAGNIEHDAPLIMDTVRLKGNR